MDEYEKTILKNNGDEIKKARLFRGMSREKLAEEASLHVNTIASIERGERDLNGISLAKIFAALGCVGIKVTKDRDIIILSDKAENYCRTDIFATPNSKKINLMGSAVRHRRLLLGMSIEELAQKVKRHKNTVWNYELGLASPTGLTIHRIYVALGVKEVQAFPDKLILL